MGRRFFLGNFPRLWRSEYYVPLPPMTSLSQYMQAEQVDRSEPVTFYVPGATDWGDRHLAVLRARRVQVHEEPLYLVDEEE